MENELEDAENIGPGKKTITAGPMDCWVGHRIDVRIYNRGTSKNAVAARMGMPRLQILRYTQARNRLTVQRLYELSQVLDTHPGWFFEGQPELPVPPMPVALRGEDAEILNPEGFDILSRFHFLTKRRKELFRDFLAMLCEEPIKDDL